MLTQLVAQAQAGNLQALEALIQRFQNMAVGLAASLLDELGGTPGAEDVAQEAFVEALRRLPDLQHPAAFPSLLHSLVRKHADRVTRRRKFRIVMLDDLGDSSAAAPVAASGDPATELAMSEMRDTVRLAVRELPEPERAVILLFYVGDQSMKEIAESLGVPVTTIKGRLHAARGRMKRKMMGMLEEKLQDERPSKSGQFQEKVKENHQATRVARYHTPMPGEEPQPPHDWDALERHRDSFEEKLLAGEPIDRKTMKRAVEMVVWDLNQFATAADLLNVYLARPGLTPAERAEASRLRLITLVFSGYRGEYVRIHREFLQWLRPFVGSAVMLEIVPDDQLMLWGFNFSGSWDLWRNFDHVDEWIEHAQQILAEMPKTAQSRRERYYLLLSIVFALQKSGRIEESWKAVRSTGDLSDEADRNWQSLCWRIEMKTLWDFNYQDRADDFIERDGVSRSVVADEIERLVNDYIPTLNLNDENEASTYYSCIHKCAEVLRRSGQHERAWAYYEIQISGGDYSFQSLIEAAATLWKLRAEQARSEVVSLLRMAAIRPDARADWALELFQTMNEFGDFHADPEFLAAVSGADTAIATHIPLG